jgi:hypothetical protein
MQALTSHPSCAAMAMMPRKKEPSVAPTPLGRGHLSFAAWAQPVPPIQLDLLSCEQRHRHMPFAHGSLRLMPVPKQTRVKA